MQDINKKIEHSVEIIKITIWPAMVLILLFSFWSPLQKVANLIPEILENSNTITLSGISIKVNESLATKASPQVKSVLAKLSSDGLERLLETANTTGWDISDINLAKAENQELISLNLITEIPQSDKNNDEKQLFQLQLTPLGKQTKRYVQLFVSELIKEVPKQQ